MLSKMHGSDGWLINARVSDCFILLFERNSYAIGHQSALSLPLFRGPFTLICNCGANSLLVFGESCIAHSGVKYITCTLSSPLSKTESFLVSNNGFVKLEFNTMLK